MHTRPVEERSRSASVTPLRADPVWRQFFAAHAVSVVGTAVTTVVLPIALFQRTGSPGWTALLTALQTIPYLLFGLVAGAVADRSDRKRIMLRADLAAAAIVGSVPAADALGVLTTAHLVVAAAGLATCFVWFDAANFGALPALVGRARVVRATSALWTFDSIALIAGPALGAVLATATSPSIALAVDAASYLGSFALIRRIRRPFAATGRVPAASTNIRSEIAEGLRYLRNHRVIRALTLSGFGNSVSFGAVLGLTVPYAVTRLGLADDDYRIGVLVAVGALGSLAAALALPRLGGGDARPALTTYALAGAAILMAALAVLTTFGAALVLWPFWEGSVQLAILNGITYRQQTVPDELLGRVNVVARMVAWGGQPFGAAIGGLLATIWGVSTALLVMVVPVTLAAVLSAKPLRGDDRTVEA
jgi:MFS family permease